MISYPADQISTVSPLEIARARRAPCFFLVNGELELVSAPVVPGLPDAGSLPPGVRETVQHLLDYDGLVDGGAIALLNMDAIIRVMALSGTDKPRYAIFVETFQARDLLGPAAHRYGFTNRETEVLALLVRGRSTIDIAAILFISELTVQAHVKNIGRKMGVTKRKEIVGAILSTQGTGAGASS